MNETALADLRHDLRTPIGHVLGYGEMVIDELTASGQVDLIADVEKIRAAGQRLLALVNERLDADSLGLTIESTPNPAKTAPLVPLQDRPVPSGNSREESEDSGLLLIVDDNEDNRTVLARRLEKQGHWAVTAASGQEALNALAEQPFDVVLLDIMMPEMDGYEVLSRIKADPLTQRLPVIMISALDEIESVVRCIEMGAADYLPKPFNPTVLRARVGASLRDKRARDR
ncbi:MAG: response regulator, partial [Janthinobacterium lividum]